MNNYSYSERKIERIVKNENLRSILNMKYVCKAANINYNNYLSFVSGHYNMNNNDLRRLFQEMCMQLDCLNNFIIKNK